MNVPLSAKIGFLIFCIALAVLLLTQLLNITQSSGLFAMGLFTFGIIRRKEKNNIGDKAK